MDTGHNRKDYTETCQNYVTNLILSACYWKQFLSNNCVMQPLHPILTYFVAKSDLLAIWRGGSKFPLFAPKDQSFGGSLTPLKILDTGMPGEDIKSLSSAKFTMRFLDIWRKRAKLCLWFHAPNMQYTRGWGCQWNGYDFKLSKFAVHKTSLICWIMTSMKITDLQKVYAFCECPNFASVHILQFGLEYDFVCEHNLKCSSFHAHFTMPTSKIRFNLPNWWCMLSNWEHVMTTLGLVCQNRAKHLDFFSTCFWNDQSPFVFLLVV